MLDLLTTSPDNAQYLAFHIRSLLRQGPLGSVRAYLDRLERIEPHSERTQRLKRLPDRHVHEQVRSARAQAGGVAAIGVCKPPDKSRCRVRDGVYLAEVRDEVRELRAVQWRLEHSHVELRDMESGHGAISSALNSKVKN